MKTIMKTFLVLTVLIVSNVHAGAPCYDGPNNTGTQYKDGDKKPGAYGGTCKDGDWVGTVANTGSDVKDIGEGDGKVGTINVDKGFENRPIKKKKK